MARVMPDIVRLSKSVLAATQRLHVPGPGAEVRVWLLRVADLDPASLGVHWLDTEERARAATLYSDAHRREYVAAHLTLRALLARRLGEAPEQVRFRRAACPACGGPHGRPELAGRAEPPVHFSLSHGDGLVLVALASAPVGVDIEPLPSEETVAAVTPTLPPAERAAVLDSPGAERRATFARAWARIEAYLKGVGTGIAVELAAVDLPAAQADGWVVSDLAADPGVAAALAMHPSRVVRPAGPSDEARAR